MSKAHIISLHVRRCMRKYSENPEATARWIVAFLKADFPDLKISRVDKEYATKCAQRYMP